ncbi:MAG: NINE protein, partial [Dokdonella sp.]
LGNFGAHKFYLGKWVQGIFYVLFFWTWIPGLIALVEFIVYACTSTERLNEKYSARGSVVVIVIVAVAARLLFGHCRKQATIG